MTGPRESSGKSASANAHTEQIEYLLYQSTQGIHFIFDNADIAQVLSRDEEAEGLSLKHMEKVQKLLSSLLERKTMAEKKSFMESLPREDYELLVRAYFQLVDKAILAHSDLRH